MSAILRNTVIRNNRRVVATARAVQTLNETTHSAKSVREGWRGTGAFQLTRVILKPCGARFGSFGCTTVT